MFIAEERITDLQQGFIAKERITDLQQVFIAEERITDLRLHVRLATSKVAATYSVAIRPHDNKLRKFLSLKLDFEYLKFYWAHCFNNLQM